MKIFEKITTFVIAIAIGFGALYWYYQTNSFSVYSFPKEMQEHVYLDEDNVIYLIPDDYGFDLIAFYGPSELGTERFVKTHYEMKDPIQYNRVLANIYVDPCGKRHGLIPLHFALQKGNEDIVCARARNTKVQFAGFEQEDIDEEADCWVDMQVVLRVDEDSIKIDNATYTKTEYSAEAVKETMLLESLADSYGIIKERE